MVVPIRAILQGLKALAQRKKASRRTPSLKHIYPRTIAILGLLLSLKAFQLSIEAQSVITLPMPWFAAGGPRVQAEAPKRTE